MSNSFLPSFTSNSEATVEERKGQHEVHNPDQQMSQIIFSTGIILFSFIKLIYYLLKIIKF